MKNFRREDLWFSLCGLNCGLCPMRLNHYCPGCGGGEGNQSCSIARCSLQRQNVEYCFQCGDYPCEKYDHIDEYDSFITHQHQKQDMEKFREQGKALYTQEQQQKRVLLEYLLDNYNDGRKKNLFCAAVNLLDLEHLTAVRHRLEQETSMLTLKERASLAASLLQEAAAECQISLKLRKKKK